MGTSASNPGAGGGVPLVPPWVPDAGSTPTNPSVPPTAGPVLIAPPARFGSSRRSLGDFARSGDASSLRKGLGSYSRRGLGGASVAAKRLGAAAVTSGALFRVLDAARTGNLAPSELGFDAAGFVGRSPREIIDRISRFVTPSNGTQDSASSQRAVNCALADLLATDPSADLMALTAEQIQWVLERHLVHEIHQRIELDVGNAIIEHAPSPMTATRRLNEVREYIEQAVAAAFRRVHASSKKLDSTTATALASSTIQETFMVFEEYIR